jgi:diguanylate cyclase (GGDEF)-like protein/PAS domain S-box-containing protein
MKKNAPYRDHPVQPGLGVSQLEDILENALECIARVDSQGNYLSVNKRYADTCGYSVDEMLGMAWEEIIYPGDRNHATRAATEVLNSGRSEIRIRGIRKNGEVINLQMVLVRGLDGTGSGIDYYCFMRNEDASAPRRNERLQHGRDLILQAIAANQPLDKILELVARTAAAVEPDLGCSVSLLDSSGQNLRCVCTCGLPDEFAVVLKCIKPGNDAGSSAMAANNGQRVISPDISTDPCWRDYRQAAQRAGIGACWVQPVISSQNKVLGTITVYSSRPGEPDIGLLDMLQAQAHLAAIAIERDRITRSIDSHKQTLEKYFDTVTESIVMTRFEDGIVLNVNRGFEQITGISREQAIGKSTIELDLWIHPEQREHMKRSLIEDGVINNAEYEFRVQDGRKILVLLSATVVDVDGEQCVFSTSRDISRWRATEQALRMSEKRLHYLTMTSHDTIFLTRVEDGTIVEVNTGFEVTTGFSREEAVGKTTLELGLWSSPEERAEYIKLLVSAGRIFDYETSYRKKDNSISHALLSATLNEVDGELYILTIARDITERKRQQQRLEQVNATLLNLGPNIDDNVDRLVATAGELLNGDYALFNRLEGDGQLHALGSWNIPSGCNPPTDCETSPCYKMIKSGDRQVYVLHGEPDPDSANSANLPARTYMGQIVHVDGQPIGSLCVLYENVIEPSEFDKELLGILVSALSREEVRRIADRTLVNITRGVSASSGESFFEYLTNYLCISMNADLAMIGCLSRDGSRITSIAISEHGKSAANISYALAGTPCESVTRWDGEMCVHKSGIQSLYPDDAWLVEFGAEGYAGVPLRDSRGMVIGLVVVLFRNQIHRELYFIEQPLAIFAARAEAELERMSTIQALVKSEEKFRDAFGKAPTGITLIDRKGYFFQTNETMSAITGYPEHDLTSLSLFDLMPVDEVECCRQEFNRLVSGEVAEMKSEKRLVTSTGTTIWVELHASTVFDEQGLFMFAVTHLIDITDRVITSFRLERSKRALQVLNDCNHGFARISNETNLLQYICEVIVATGKYRMAWVGYCQFDEDKTVKPMAYAGVENGYLAHTVTWADEPRGRGPVGTCIRSLQACIARFISSDSRFGPWRSAALERGYQSAAALPIIIEGCVIGALVLYAEVTDAFDTEEVMLLNDLTNNLARGIQNIRVKSDHERARRDLQASEQKFRMAFNNASMGMLIVNRDGMIQEVNDAGHDMLGYTRHDLIGEPVSKIIHPEDVVHSLEYRNKLYSGELEHYRIQKRYLHKNGHVIHAILNASIIKSQGEYTDHMVAMIEDITQRLLAEQALQESEERFRTLYDDTPSMFFTIDEQGLIQSVNEFGARELGYEVHELCRQKAEVLIHPEDMNLYQSHINMCLDESEHIQRLEFRKIKKDGTVIWVRETIRMIRKLNDERMFLVVCEDISEIKRLSSQLSYQASHDALTGLVNRLEFERRLERVIQSPESADAEHALCFLDMDQFKVINDSCGHLAGDELLRQLSEVISASVRKRDTLARLGGDEFGILMEHCSLDKAQRVAGQILRRVEEFRFLWENKRFSLGVSIGLVPIIPGTSSVTSILKEADAACYAAKDAGRNRIHLYQPDDINLSRIRGEMQWVSIINEAVEEDHLLLYRQDIKPLFTSGPTGRHYEILLRLRAHDGQIVQPGAFMPAAERYNLSPRIDTWVIKTCLSWLHENPRHADELTRCTINLSGLSLSHPNFVDMVLEEFQRCNVPGEKICFEITETTAIQNMSNAVKFMQLLKAIGCSFALDDFGSGVSSFAYLKQIPVDYIKIDGGFVREMTRDQVNFEMVRAINDIARVMGIQTIAEFVESEEILHLLQGLGVPFGQGYFIHEPEPLME